MPPVPDRTASLRRAASPCVSAVALAFLAVSAVSAAPASYAQAPPLDLTGMTFVSSTDDDTEVVVRAETARYRPDADVADLDRVTAFVHPSPGKTIEIRCDEGTLNLDSNSFWARGNVRGRTDDGREFRAPWVRYSHEEGLLYTNAPVRIAEAGTTLEGGGFRYYVREDRFRLLGGATVVQEP